MGKVSTGTITRVSREASNLKLKQAGFKPLKKVEKTMENSIKTKNYMTPEVKSDLEKINDYKAMLARCELSSKPKNLP